MNLAEASEAYQAQLELLRAAESAQEMFSEDALAALREDMAKARRELEVAWLERL